MQPFTPIVDPEGRTGFVRGPSGCAWLDTIVAFKIRRADGGTYTSVEHFAASSLRPDDGGRGKAHEMYSDESARRGWPEMFR